MPEWKTVVEVVYARLNLSTISKQLEIQCISVTNNQNDLDALTVEGFPKGQFNNQLTAVQL